MITETPIARIVRVLGRIEDLKMDLVILGRYAEEAKSLGDDEYYANVMAGLTDTEKSLKMTRDVLRALKEKNRKRTGD